MAKVNIKLKNKTDNQILESKFIGIKTDNKIKYKDNNITSVIEINNNELNLERKCDDYTISLHLSLDKITKGYYNINNIGLVNLNIETNKLLIKSNEIETEYTLIFDNNEKQVIEFILELEEIK